jgi:hypothetical protein
MGIDTRSLAHTFYRSETEGQSPFAFEMGLRFEIALAKKDGFELRTVYERHGRFTDPSFLDLTHEGDPLSRTLSHLRARSAGQEAPDMIWQGALPSPVEGELIRPDLLVADGRFYRPGEVKSYEDRGGLTNPADLDSAIGQAAVSLVAMRALSGYAYPRDAVFVDIILRSPSGMRPRLKSLSAERDVSVIEASLSEFPLNGAHVRSVLDRFGVSTIDSPAALEALPHRYLPSCRERCGLALVCKRRAMERGEFAAFGASISESLAPYRTMAELDVALKAGSEDSTVQTYRRGVAALSEILDG